MPSVRRWFGAERIALAIFVFVGLWLIGGQGWAGLGGVVAAAAILGLVVGLIGRRYPMIYSQNRRDRRRRHSSN
jgi:membrane associated rhomboid family serine protease